jgi:4-aminobutyrate aminotransferase
MVGVEFASPSTGPYDPFTRPDAPANIASRVSKKCTEKGMLLLTTSVYQVVRFIPPLNITERDLKKGIEIFKQAVREVVEEK